MTFYNPPYGTEIDQDSLSFPSDSTQQVVGGGRSFIVTMVTDGPFTVRDRRSIQTVIAVYTGSGPAVALTVTNSGGIVDTNVSTIDAQAGITASEVTAGKIALSLPGVYQMDVRTISTPISVPNGGPSTLLTTGIGGFPAIPISMGIGSLYRIEIEIILYAQSVTSDPVQTYSFTSNINGQTESVASPSTTGYNKASNVGFNVNSGTLTGTRTPGQIVVTINTTRPTITTDGVTIVWGRIITRATAIW